MPSDLLLLTPPMTQLNTPYPGTAYLCRYLRGQGFSVEQGDLGIELIHRLYSKDFFLSVCEDWQEDLAELSPGSQRIIQRSQTYANSIEAALAFLQGETASLAHRIVTRRYLPEGKRFSLLETMPAELLGDMALQDKAKLYATLFIEDLSFFFQETVSEHFEFTRYAEKISQFLPDFSPLYDYLQEEEDAVASFTLEILAEKIEKYQPKMIGFSVPFPGNLYAAFLCAQFIRQEYPEIKILLGGGFVNTELRQLSDPRVFEFFDYVSLDDGEVPLERILQKEGCQPDSLQLVAEGSNNAEQELSGPGLELCRTFVLENDQVVYHGEVKGGQLSHELCGWPDYKGLDMSLYLNTFDVANPMNRLWSDGRWNKMTVAHGCYWKRCTFCDVNLDYISRYSEAPATMLCDRMEQIIEETGETGFHFVDEACPPDLMLELSLEILRRGLQVSWWGNIRFEKAFTPDLAELMAKAGCIAVSGGLEVAEERLLKLIKKGTGIKQTVQALTSFREAGIMVHAYLMYGFPTQTNQETIEALETVRQLFKEKLIDSAFWHRFALTAHSPVFTDPAAYDIEILDQGPQGFARNEIAFRERSNKTDHSSFAEGLRQAVYNFMHGQLLDLSAEQWFDQPMPKPLMSKKTVPTYIDYTFAERLKARDKSRVIYHSDDFPVFNGEEAFLGDFEEPIHPSLAECLSHLLPQLDLDSDISLGDFQSFISEHLGDDAWSYIQESGLWAYLRANGLFVFSQPRRHKAQV